MPYLDSAYLYLVLPAIIISMWASYNVNSTFKKFSKIRNLSGLTGADAARMVLNNNGLNNVSIERVSGNLTDHYDPRSNVIRLSESVYDSPTAAAVGVAAHEAGHAIQHSENYFPVKLRSALIPITNIASNLAIPLVLFGIFFSIPLLADIGCIVFIAVILFQLATLFSEFNASSRAMTALTAVGTLSIDELNGARQTLKAAALTYLAALALAIANLLRLLNIANRSRRN